MQEDTFHSSINYFLQISASHNYKKPTKIKTYLEKQHLIW